MTTTVHKLRYAALATLVTALIGTASVAAGLAIAHVLESRFPGHPLELICYRDATLTERHVGVARAVYNERGVWTLFYRDGEATGATVYRQEPGEACMTVEEVVL